jgi:hypothetical protein
MHTRLALLACALALVAVPAIVLAGGAGGADGGPETAAATVDTPNGSVISLAPSNGSNGAYASISGGELLLQFDDLNENATTTAHEVFVVNVTASEPASIRVTNDAPGVDFYWGDDPTASANDSRTVQPGEQVAVGVQADSFGALDDGNFTVLAEQPEDGGGPTVVIPGPPSGDGGLSVVDASVSPTELAVGESATATATVANSGSSAASGTVELEIDGTVVDRQTVTVPGESTETVEFEREFQQAGEYEVTVGGMDAGTVAVGGSGFVVSNATLSPGTIQPGDSTTISANVTNHRDSAAYFDAELSVGGVVVEQQAVRIRPGETVRVSFERTFDRRGGYEIAIGGAEAGTLRVESSTESTMRRYGSEWGWLLGAASVPTLGAAFVAARRRRRFLGED